MLCSERHSHDDNDDVVSNNNSVRYDDGLNDTADPYSLIENKPSCLENEASGDEVNHQSDQHRRKDQTRGKGKVERQESDFRKDRPRSVVFVAAWIQANFPEISNEADLLLSVTASRVEEGCNARSDAPLPNLGQEAHVCEECNTGLAGFVCEDCDLVLCFKCTDAIHIISSLSMHKISLVRNVGKSPSRVRETRFTTEDTARSAIRLSIKVTSTSIQKRPLPRVSTTHLEKPRLLLPPGTCIFFRSLDCSRWPRELLHGTLASLTPATTSSEGTFYHRVLWLRGVEALPNGFYRASLALPGWDFRSDSDGLGMSYWPQKIGVFPTQLAALRAVVTAEQIARAKFRREVAGGRMRGWGRIKQEVNDDIGFEGEEAFPSSTILDEVIAETAETLDHEFAVRLTHQDDQRFHQKLSGGTWSFRKWMESIGRGDDLREEGTVSYENRAAATAHSDDISGMVDAKIPMPWPPATRIRFFMIAQHELVFPDHVCRQHLRAIMEQLLLVYAGFAWRLWRDYVSRHRERDEKQKRDCAACVLQRWARRIAERRRQQEYQQTLQQELTSSADVLELFRRRQVEARKLYVFLQRQADERKRHALRFWFAVVGPKNPSPPPAITWHPSYGMKSMLPKLPRMGARRHKAQDKAAAPGCQLVIEDMTTFKMFQANHTGPVDSSYWVIRSRVLAGVCPVGPAFRDARRIVSRTDVATSVLLQQISVFVCLMEPQELRNLDVAQGGTTNSGSEWSFEHQVRTKYQALCMELNGAETISKRHVELARRALAEFDAEAANITAAVMSCSGTSGNKKRRASLAVQQQQQKEEDDEEAKMKKMREPLEQRLQLTEQQATKAAGEAARLATMELEFLYFPIAHDGVPESDHLLLDYLEQQVECRLRAGKNLYVFSRLGHGRTGLVAALLLGRIYGITAAEALDRAQRTHDCQRPGALRGIGYCSPTTASQIAFVRRALARSMDPIYTPLVLENSSVEYRSVRSQQRGLLAEPFMRAEGFMISAAIDSQGRKREVSEQKRLQRIARNDRAAVLLQRQRRYERQERGMMELEECMDAAISAMANINDRIEDES